MATKFEGLRAQLTKQDEEWASAVDRLHGLPASFAVPAELLKELDDALAEPAPPVAFAVLPIGIRV